MRTLVYKRTHPGDPDERGVFGNEDCMGQVRGFEFDAVIGIGGIGNEARSFGIDGKINWIGSGAHKDGWNGRSPYVVFERFVLFEERGELVSAVAPALARRFCHARAPRYVLDRFSDREREEIQRILAMVRKRPPSPGRFRRVAAEKCRRRCPPKRC